MRTKQIVILFLLGTVVAVIAILFNIMHWPYGKALLILSTSLQLTAGLVGILKLASTEEFKELF